MARPPPAPARRQRTTRAPRSCPSIRAPTREAFRDRCYGSQPYAPAHVLARHVATHAGRTWILGALVVANQHASLHAERQAAGDHAGRRGIAVAGHAAGMTAGICSTASTREGECNALVLGVAAQVSGGVTLGPVRGRRHASGPSRGCGSTRPAQAAGSSTSRAAEGSARPTRRAAGIRASSGAPAGATSRAAGTATARAAACHGRQSHGARCPHQTPHRTRSPRRHWEEPSSGA